MTERNPKYLHLVSSAAASGKTTFSISQHMPSDSTRLKLCPTTYNINGLPPFRYPASSRKFVSRPMLTNARQKNHSRTVFEQPSVTPFTRYSPPGIKL